jgi:hypothetical protein
MAQEDFEKLGFRDDHEESRIDSTEQVRKEKAGFVAGARVRGTRSSPN